jgi:hypothetical protein
MLSLPPSCFEPDEAPEVLLIAELSFHMASRAALGVELAPRRK